MAFQSCPGWRQAWTLTLNRAAKTPFDPRFDPVNFSASPNSLSSMITVSFRDQFIPA
jgi:hypothetical protein